MARGFTLLELMVVIAIMSVTLAVVGPGLANRLEGAAVHSAAADLQSLAKAARGFAVINDVTVRLGLEASGREIHLQEHNGTMPGHPPALLLPPRRLPEGVVVRFRPDAADGQAAEYLRFHPDGTGDPGILSLNDSRGGRVQLRSIGPVGRLYLLAQPER